MQLPSEPDPFSEGWTARRLRRLATARLEPGEQLVSWTRAWVSIDGRFNRVVAARTRDFLVLTDRRLMLWSTGFFTRMARRRVLADRLDELSAQRFPPLAGLQLRVTAPQHKALRFELKSGDESVRFATEFMARIGGAAVAAAAMPDAPVEGPADDPVDDKANEA